MEALRKNMQFEIDRLTAALADAEARMKVPLKRWISTEHYLLYYQQFQIFFFNRLASFVTISIDSLWGCWGTKTGKNTKKNLLKLYL